MFGGNKKEKQSLQDSNEELFVSSHHNNAAKGWAYADCMPPLAHRGYTDFALQGSDMI